MHCVWSRWPAWSGSSCDRLQCTVPGSTSPTLSGISPTLSGISPAAIITYFSGTCKPRRRFRQLISTAAFHRQLPQPHRPFRSFSAAFRRQLPQAYRVFRSFFAAAFRRWFSTVLAAAPPVLPVLGFCFPWAFFHSPCRIAVGTSVGALRCCFPSADSGRPRHSPLRFPTFSASGFSPRATTGPFAGSFAVKSSPGAVAGFSAAGLSSRAPPRFSPVPLGNEGAMEAAPPEAAPLLRRLCFLSVIDGVAPYQNLISDETAWIKAVSLVFLRSIAWHRAAAPIVCGSD